MSARDRDIEDRLAEQGIVAEVYVHEAVPLGKLYIIDPNRFRNLTDPLPPSQLTPEALRYAVRHLADLQPDHLYVHPDDAESLRVTLGGRDRQVQDDEQHEDGHRRVDP